MRVGEDRVKKARVQVLKRQLNKLQMEDSKTVNEYSMKLTTLVAEVRSLGAKLDDSKVVEKLFSSVPDRFLQIIGTIEQFSILRRCRYPRQSAVSEPSRKVLKVEFTRRAMVIN